MICENCEEKVPKGTGKYMDDCLVCDDCWEKYEMEAKFEKWKKN